MKISEMDLQDVIENFSKKELITIIIQGEKSLRLAQSIIEKNGRIIKIQEEFNKTHKDFLNTTVFGRKAPQ